MSIEIRVARDSDAGELLAIYDYYVRETAITFDYETPSLAQFQAKMSTIQEHYPYLVASDGQVILGYAYAGPFHTRTAYQWLAETSIYLAPGARGHGLGKQLYQALESCMQAQGILTSMACIATTTEPDRYLNNASLGFHQHLGYQVVGKFDQSGYKFGRWYDMQWLEKALASKSPEPKPIKAFNQTTAYQTYQKN